MALPEYVEAAAKEELEIMGSSRCALQYHHLATVRQLAESSQPILDLRPLVRRLLACVEQNWILSGQDDRGSQENWRLQKRDPLALENRRAEEILNRSIAAATQGDWANEVAISSGIAGDGSMHVDLVYELVAGEHYEVIELKWDSNTPLYAAIQVAVYGVYYLFSRVHAERFNYSDPVRPMLSASRIDLRVLAPTPYYSDIEGSAWFRDFEARLNEAVEAVGRETLVNDFSMGFAYTQLPADFVGPEASADAIQSAVAGRQAVFV